jgi:hypothetical protein
MARFQTADAFEVPEKRLELLPFRFERRAEDYLVSNMVGDFVALIPVHADQAKNSNTAAARSFFTE